MSDSVLLPRELVDDLLAYFDQRADADCEGDPPRYRPNEEMQLQRRLAEYV